MRPNSYNGGPAYDAKKADQEIKYCTSCKRCWQIDNESSRTMFNRARKKIVYNHYDNFPTIGKKRKTCMQCSK